MYAKTKIDLVCSYKPAFDLHELARMRVPKLVKNGFYSSFAFLRPIRASLIGQSQPCQRWKTMGVDDKPITEHNANTSRLPAQFEKSGH
jgi:hypothetical protein